MTVRFVRSGAKRAPIPVENKRNFLDVSADIMESTLVGAFLRWL